MTEATTKLLSGVSEAGGGPWGTVKELTEPDLLAWLGVQQDRVEELKEKLYQRGREIARQSLRRTSRTQPKIVLRWTPISADLRYPSELSNLDLRNPI